MTTTPQRPIQPAVELSVLGIPPNLRLPGPGGEQPKKIPPSLH